MNSLRPAIPTFSHLSLSILLMVGALACSQPPGRLPPPDAGAPDGSEPGCATPSAGCPCAPGTAPIECSAPPTMVDGEILCQHGTRYCRDAVWTGCEGITAYPPPNNKILGAPSAIDVCTPDQFRQQSVPDLVDVNDPLHGINVDYRPTGLAGVIMASPQNAANNYGLGVDTDGDGAPDLVDQCPNAAGWASPCDGDPTNDGFFHILQPGDTTQDPWPVIVQAPPVEVYVLTDNGLTMAQEIADLQGSFTAGTLVPGCAGGVLGALGCASSDYRVGLGMAGDFPAAAEGDVSNFPFVHLLDPTADGAAAQRHIAMVQTLGSRYVPQATGHALYALGTGNGLARYLPNRVCTAGSGWGCMETATRRPVVVVSTDAPFWSGSSGVGTYAGFAANGGSATSAAFAMAPGGSTSTTGQNIASADALAGAFQLGDLTAASRTMVGSTAGMADDDATTCGGVGQSGPDMYYEFTTTANASFLIEADGDFDASIRLLDGTADVGCDLDSGAWSDANNATVYDDGALIDTRTLTGSGIVTDNTTFSNCSVATAVGTAQLTNCAVQPNTVSSALTGCQVDTVPSASTFTGCAVAATPEATTLSGCSTVSTTTAHLVSCSSFGSTQVPHALSGCVPSGAVGAVSCTGSTGTVAASGCTPTSTATTTALACTDQNVTANLSGCTPSGGSAYPESLTCTGTQSTSTFVTFSGCSYGGSLTGCTVAASGFTVASNCSVNNNSAVITCKSNSQLALVPGNSLSAAFGGIPTTATIQSVSRAFASPTYTYTITMSATATQNQTNKTASWAANATNVYCTGGVSTLAVGQAVTVGGTATTVASVNGSNRFALASGASTSAIDSGITFGGARVLTCTTISGGSVQVGGAVNGALAGTTVTDTGLFNGNTLIALSQDQGATPVTSITGQTLSTTYTALTGCTPGDATTVPAVGMTLSGGGLSSTAITAVTSSSGTYTVSFAGITSAPSLTPSLGNAIGYTTFTGCSIASGAIAAGMVVSGSGIRAGTTVASYSGGTLTLSQRTALTGTAPTATAATGLAGATCTATGVQPQVGATIAGSGLGAAGVTIASATSLGGNLWELVFNTTVLSATGITSASQTSFTSFTGCQVPEGILADMSLTGTGIASGTTIVSFVETSTSPRTFTLNLDRPVTSVATVASLTSAGSIRAFTGCSGVIATNDVVSGTGIPGGTTASNVTGASPNLVIALSGWAPSTATLSGALSAYTQFIGCVSVDGTVPTTASTPVGTGLPVASPAIAGVTNTGPNTYTIDIGGGTLSGAAATLTSFTTGAVDYTTLLNCTFDTPPTATTATVAGPAIASQSATITGTGPYTLSLTTAATANNTSISFAQTTSYDRTRQTCTSWSGSTPVAGMTVSGFGIVALPTATTASNVIFSGGAVSFDLSQSATADNASAAAGAYTTYDRSRVTNCTLVAGPAPVDGMTVSGTGIAAGTTVTTVIGSAAPYTFLLSQNAVSDTGAVSASSQPIPTNTLSGCLLASGTLTTGMAITGTLIPGGTTIASFTGTGTAVDPYVVTLSNTPTSAGPTSADGTITLPSDTLTGCVAASGVPYATMSVTGTGIAAGTTIASFTGPSAGTYTVVLDQPATSLVTTTLSGTINLPTTRLTGCTMLPGDVIRAGMVLSGSNIAAGATLASYSGTGTGPYTIFMDVAGTAGGATTLDGTFTGPPLLYPSGLPAGTYRIVVDSAGAAESGSFQLRVTNLAASSAVATTPTEVGFANTVAALSGLGATVVGVASCDGGCTNLDALQATYEACIATADGTTGSGPCAVAYGTCMASSYAGTLCADVHATCLDSETRSVLSGGVATRACEDAEAECLANFPVCPKVYIVDAARCGSNAITAEPVSCYVDDPTCATAGLSAITECATLRAGCEAQTDPCSTDAAAIVACEGSVAAAGAPEQTLCDETLTDLVALGTGTGSVRPDATTYTYRVDANGQRFARTVASGLDEAIASFTSDVVTACVPSTANSCTFFQGTPLTTGLTPVRTVLPNCSACSTTGCTACTPDTNIPFELLLQNAGTITPLAVEQIFDFSVEARDTANVLLNSTPVRVVVPPQRRYPNPGTFRQVFDGTYDSATGAGCVFPGTRAFWGTFTYSINVPFGTSVTFRFTPADTTGELSTNPSITQTFTSSVTNGTIDLGTLFLGAGMPASAAYVKMEAILTSDPTFSLTPVLLSYGQEFTCFDAE